MATKTTVIVLCKDALIIWVIPPLSPQPPDFFDYNPTHIPPLATFRFLDYLTPRPEHAVWKCVSSWYFGSPHSPYIDLLCQEYSELHRFQILLKPDLTTAFLRSIYTSELTAQEFDYVYFHDYTTCQDITWFYDDRREDQCLLYTGLTSSPSCFANIISHGGPWAKMFLPDIGCMYHLLSCPASGRFVRLDSNDSIAILDFF